MLSGAHCRIKFEINFFSDAPATNNEMEDLESETVANVYDAKDPSL